MNVSVSMACNEIDLYQLKALINTILDTLIERTKSGVFQLPDHVDNYWEVLGDDMFNLSKKPNELGIGSLVDDIELLAHSSHEMKEGYPLVIYNLVHAVPLLKFLAEQHSKSDRT